MARRVNNEFVSAYKAAGWEAARKVAALPPAPVRTAQAGVARVTNAARTATSVRSGILNAVGQQPLAVAMRAGGVGAIAAIGFAAAQTETGQRAVQRVQGYWRMEPSTRRQTYVHPHERRVG